MASYKELIDEEEGMLIDVDRRMDELFYYSLHSSFHNKPIPRYKLENSDYTQIFNLMITDVVHVIKPFHERESDSALIERAARIIYDHLPEVLGVFFKDIVVNEGLARCN